MTFARLLGGPGLEVRYAVPRWPGEDFRRSQPREVEMDKKAKTPKKPKQTKAGADKKK